jgi:uncharacterized protein YkwD
LAKHGKSAREIREEVAKALKYYDNQRSNKRFIKPISIVMAVAVIGVVVYFLRPDSLPDLVDRGQVAVTQVFDKISAQLEKQPDSLSSQASTTRSNPLQKVTSAVGIRPSQELGEIESNIVGLINRQREVAGLQTLIISGEMSKLAMIHSVSMGNRNDLFTEQDTQLEECYKQEGQSYWESYAQVIAQTWLYSSTTYVNGVPIRQWRTQEQLSDNIVDVWAEYFEETTLLDPMHDRLGIGISITSDDRVYATLNFC